MLDIRGNGPPTVVPATEIGIDDKVRFLRDPRHYPGNGNRVDALETHYSWVFLSGDRAYKLKKPARGDGFDFTSVGARLRNAQTELRLNRRLAAKIYLGIVALIRQPGGRLRLGGDGEAVDWLVQMRRFDPDRMLDRRIASGQWRYGELEALAQRLARFFASGQRSRLTPRDHIGRLRVELRKALAAHRRIGEPRLAHRAASLVRVLDAFIARRERLFRRRVTQGRVIDGHGDLRPEHVCSHGVPQIIDCLEFRADLRQLDPVSEIAFLALECGRLGASPIAGRLLRRYREVSGDRPDQALFRFYTAFNAIVRARLAIEHIADPGARTRAQWIERAESYLAVAARECRLLCR